MFHVFGPIIGIALSVLAGAVGFSFLGNSFSDNKVAANAAMFVTQASQISAAWDLAKVDAATAPTAIADLETEYLKSIPVPPTGTWAVDTDTGLLMAEVTDEDVCSEIAARATSGLYDCADLNDVPTFTFAL